MLAERARVNRERASELTPPWGTAGLGEADGCALRAVVAEAYLAEVRAGSTAERARAAAGAAGLEWAARRAADAAVEEADCCHAAYARGAD